MTTRKIQRDEWPEFFDSFSRQHQAWLVTIEVLDPDIGDQIAARQLPLEGIVVESGNENKTQIEIIVGEKPDSHISHTITSPDRVWLKQSDEGSDKVIEIESEGGFVLLRIGPAVRMAEIG